MTKEFFNFSSWIAIYIKLWIVSIIAFIGLLFLSSNLFNPSPHVYELVIKLLIFDVLSGIIFFTSSIYLLILKIIYSKFNLGKVIYSLAIFAPFVGLVTSALISGFVNNDINPISGNSRTGLNTVANLAIEESTQEMKNKIYEKLNSERVSLGLSKLSINQDLELSSLAKANDIISKGYWAHESPSGETPWDLFGIVGYKYIFAGENLSKDIYTADAVHASWMNSPSHKENIVSKNYTEIGVSVLDGEVNGVKTRIAVQHFGTPYNSANTTNANFAVNYYEWCTGKNIQVNQKDIIVQKSSDGNTYGMIKSDWDCYESFLRNETPPQREASRTGRIINYKEYCTGKDISIYENELLYQKARDGKIYAMTQGDWDCYWKK